MARAADFRQSRLSEGEVDDLRSELERLRGLVGRPYVGAWTDEVIIEAAHQRERGDWLGIGRRTSQGYALGEYPVPEPVAKLLRLCVRLKLNPDDVK